MLVDNLPGYILLSLAELGLILIGYFVERHYVSRVTVFSNALALNVHLLSLQEISAGVALFADFALLFGAGMLGLYVLQKSAPGIFYILAMYPMSSIVIGTVIWSPFEPWYVNLVLGIVFQMGHALLHNSLGGEGLTHEGRFSGQISRFVDDATLEFVDVNGIHRHVDLALTQIETSPWWLK